MTRARMGRWDDDHPDWRVGILLVYNVQRPNMYTRASYSGTDASVAVV